MGWGTAAEFAMRIVDKFVPDPAAKAANALEIQRMQQAGEFKEIDTALQMAQVQTDVNKVEAANSNIFVAGWRPHIGWVCGFAFGAHFIYFPFITWVAALNGHPIDFPKIDTQELFTLMLGMLGLSGMRSYDKKQGSA
jgi:hypothetical protein